MDVLHVASAGEPFDSVLTGVRQLPVSRMRLLYRDEEADVSKRLVDLLSQLRVDVEPRRVTGPLLRAVFTELSTAARDARENGQDVQVNASSGPREMGQAALAASYLLGLSAFEVEDGEPVFLPILRFGYDDVVSAPKVRIMHTLADDERSRRSLQALADAAGLEKSLVSYHLRGSGDTRGLEQLGLVQIERGSRGRLQLSLSSVGEFFLTAYDARHAPLPTGNGRASSPSAGVTTVGDGGEGSGARPHRL